MALGLKEELPEPDLSAGAAPPPTRKRIQVTE